MQRSENLIQTTVRSSRLCSTIVWILLLATSINISRCHSNLWTTDRPPLSDYFHPLYRYSPIVRQENNNKKGSYGGLSAVQRLEWQREILMLAASNKIQTMVLDNRLEQTITGRQSQSNISLKRHFFIFFLLPRSYLENVDAKISVFYPLSHFNVLFHFVTRFSECRSRFIPPIGITTPHVDIILHHIMPGKLNFVLFFIQLFRYFCVFV
jgi:hypothetical protein